MVIDAQNRNSAVLRELTRNCCMLTTPRTPNHVLCSNDTHATQITCFDHKCFGRAPRTRRSRQGGGHFGQHMHLAKETQPKRILLGELQAAKNPDLGRLFQSTWSRRASPPRISESEMVGVHPERRLEKTTGWFLSESVRQAARDYPDG